MKKIVLILVALFVAAAPTIASELHVDPPKPSKEIPINEGKPKPGPVPTSLENTVEARYTAEISLLEVYFNREIGSATISLIDNMTGQTLIAYACDSALEPQIYLNIALDAGFYSLRIIGPDYEGYGDFDL